MVSSASARMYPPSRRPHLGGPSSYSSSRSPMKSNIGSRFATTGPLSSPKSSSTSSTLDNHINRTAVQINNDPSRNYYPSSVTGGGEEIEVIDVERERKIMILGKKRISEGDGDSTAATKTSDDTSSSQPYSWASLTWPELQEAVQVLTDSKNGSTFNVDKRKLFEGCERGSQAERLRLISLLKKSQMLSCCDGMAAACGVGPTRYDDDDVIESEEDIEEDLFESAVRVEIPGVNPSEFTPEERAFVEDALLQSFQKAIESNTAFEVQESYFVVDSDAYDESAAFAERRSALEVEKRQNKGRWDALITDMMCGVVDGKELVKDIAAAKNIASEKLMKIPRGDVALGLKQRSAHAWRKHLGVSRLNPTRPISLTHSFRLRNSLAAASASGNNGEGGKFGAKHITDAWLEQFKKEILFVPASELDIFVDVEDCKITLDSVEAVDKQSAQKKKRSSGRRNRTLQSRRDDEDEYWDDDEEDREEDDDLSSDEDEETTMTFQRWKEDLYETISVGSLTAKSGGVSSASRWRR